ncbi:MAG: amidase [Alphaproteobacteria bacterium]|nr:MAG: amidase [Alphaproteobacteria bacterium]
MTDWLTMPAAALGRGIEAGRIDPRALTDAFLAAIAAHPDSGRIYSAVTAARARAEAEAAAGRARRGLRRGPLDGVPVSWKDLFDSAGTATEAGTRLLKGRVPAEDATVLAEATRAGLVCLGKTHMTELAFSGLGLNPVTATPPGRHDPEALAGGSSSGAAASVAHGLAAAAIGSDTGGSIRVPAAWNDLVGFKPTHGALPLRGVVPLCPRFDTVGPLARSVEDAAELVAAMGGGRAPDLAAARVAGLSLVVLEEMLEGCEAGPLAAFADALARLARAGARIARVRPAEVGAAMALPPELFTAEAWAEWGETIAAAPGLMFPPIRARFEAGRGADAAAWLRAEKRMQGLRRSWAQAMAGHDAALLPSVAIMPPRAQAVLDDHALFAERNMMALRNTRLGNLLGATALTLPTGHPAAGLMAMAPGGWDRRLLRAGAAMERALAG